MAFFRFTAATEGQNKLRLREALQQFSVGFGVPAHVYAETAAAIVLDAFKRQVRVELELLELTCVRS